MRPWGSIVAVFALTSWMPPAAAQPAPPDSVEAFDQTLRAWMERSHVGQGSLAVAYRGRLVYVAGYGGQAADAPAGLASNSKAITAVCIATLIRDGKLRLETTVGEALGDFFRRYGDPSDPRLKSVTVAQLLIHRGGYARDRDPATGSAFADFLRATSVRSTDYAALFRRALREPLAIAPGSAYSYANTHYLILGLVVEAAAGRPYEEHCRDAVLAPLGIDKAALNPHWRIMGPFGGWSLSGAQYLAFLRAFAQDSPVLSPDMRRWTFDDTDKWTNADKSAFYSLGVLVRRTANGFNVWHSGAIFYRTTNAYDGPIDASFGAYAVLYDSGAAWFASYVPLPSDAARGELDREMGRVARGIKSWPEGTPLGR